MHGIVSGGDGNARAEGMAAAGFEALVLHDIELVGQGVDGGVAEAVIVIPAEPALIERHCASEEHRELPSDNGGRMPLGGGVPGQRDAVAMQPDFDAPDLV